MRLVIVESPYQAKTKEDLTRNIQYATQALRDSISRGESPYASHLILLGALDDNDPRERDLGIRCGYAWWGVVDAICFYIDLGWSPGMIAARKRANRYNMLVEERSIESYRY